MNSGVLYELADTLHITVSSNGGKVTGKGKVDVQLLNIVFPFHMAVVGHVTAGNATLFEVDGPGEMFLLVLIASKKSKYQTTLFICDRAKLEPATAFPEKSATLTPKFIQSHYGPSVVHSVTKKAGQKEWQP